MHGLSTQQRHNDEMMILHTITKATTSRTDRIEHSYIFYCLRDVRSDDDPLLRLERFIRHSTESIEVAAILNVVIRRWHGVARMTPITFKSLKRMAKRGGT